MVRSDDEGGQDSRRFPLTQTCLVSGFTQSVHVHSSERMPALSSCVCVCVSADACLGAPLLHLKSAAVLPLPAGLHRPNPYVNVSGSFRLPLVYGGGFFF